MAVVVKGLRRFRFKKGCNLRMQPGSFGLNYADIEFFDDSDSEESEESSFVVQKAQKFLGGDQHLMTSATHSLDCARSATWSRACCRVEEGSEGGSEGGNA